MPSFECSAGPPWWQWWDWCVILVFSRRGKNSGNDDYSLRCPPWHESCWHRNKRMGKFELRITGWALWIAFGSVVVVAAAAESIPSLLVVHRAVFRETTHFFFGGGVNPPLLTQISKEKGKSWSFIIWRYKKNDRDAFWTLVWTMCAFQRQSCNVLLNMVT